MNSYYNLDGVQSYIKKEIAETSALLDAWTAVTFPTKKNGEPFSNLAKNIDGARLQPRKYSMQPGEHELTVYAFNKSVGHISDTIAAYRLVKDLKDPEKLAKTGNILPKVTMLHQVYQYDLDDIKQAVAGRVEYMEKRLASLEYQLKISATTYEKFLDDYSTAIETLEKRTDKSNNPDLFYAIRDTIISRYPYC